MDVNRILQLADRLYGEETRRQIFEPLAADLQRELAANPKLALRWRIAVVAAFVRCAPRAFTLRLPRALWLEIVSRVVLFGALAFFLQRALNEPGRAWPGIAASSLSFVVIPAVWRIRVAALPSRERRMIVVLFVAQVAIVQALFGEGGLTARLTLAATAPVLAFCGWKLRDAERERISPLAAHPLMRIVMVATVLIIASWPVKLALGINFSEPRWRSDDLVTYVIAGLVIVTMGREEVHSPDRRRT